MRIQGYIALLLFIGAAAATPGCAQDLSGRELIDALRRGGYNIYFRHAATDWSRDDHISGPGDWTSCDPQRMRQLSAEGRTVAEGIGSAIRSLGIPIGRVFASEYCRARETAQHLGLGPVSPTLAVMNMRAAQFFAGGRQTLIERARQALSTPPQAGTNTVFVAHGNLMQAVSEAYVVEAGAAVFLPQGNGQFRLVAKLTPEAWHALAREHTPEPPS